jgi:hypothetical protein
VPSDEPFVVVGTLRDNGTPYPSLAVEGGGEWRLDIDQRYRHLLGVLVRVEGVREDFNVLAVVRINVAG